MYAYATEFELNLH